MLCIDSVGVELDTGVIGVSIHRIMNAWFTRERDYVC